MAIQPMLGYVRELLARVLQPGDVAIDGTVGKGQDTLFLAEQVGADGQVFGFDIQASALELARQRLAAAGLTERVTYFQESHARMKELVPQDVHGRVKAITFNLGYLPGGDLTIVTTEASTLPALQAALDLLMVGGVLTVMLYAGHAEGKVESQVVQEWASGLDTSEAHVLSYRFLNQRNDPPVLLAIEKRKGKSRP